MFPLTRWQLCRLLIQVIFKRDYLAVARTLFAVLFPAHETVTTVDEPKEPQTKPPRFEYDPIASRMVKRSLAGLLVLASVSSAWALGSVDVMDPITKLGKRLTGGDGITISGSTISASGTATAFANYTSAEGGRVTVDVFANHTSSLGSAAYTASSDYATAAQGAKADTALQPGSSASTLAGAVIGRLTPDLASAGRYLGAQTAVTTSAASPNATAEVSVHDFYGAYNGVGTLLAQEAITISSRNTGTGTVSNLIGPYIVNRNTGGGTVTNNKSMVIGAPVNSGGSTLANSYGIQIEDQGAAGAANSTTALSIANQTGATYKFAIVTGKGFNQIGDWTRIRRTETGPINYLSSGLVGQSIADNFSGSAGQVFGLWGVGAGPTTATHTSWGVVGGEVNSFERYVDAGYMETRAGRWSAGWQVVPESELDVGAGVQRGYNGTFGLLLAHSSAPEYGDGSRTYPASKWHVPITVQQDATAPGGTSLLLRGGSDAANDPSTALKITDYQGLGIDTSTATMASDAVRISPAQTIGDGTNSYTLAQLANPTTSAALRTELSDETGTGAAVFAGGNIGSATGTSLVTSGTSVGLQVNNNAATIRLKDNDDGTNASHFTLQDASTAQAVIVKTSVAGNASIDWDQKPLDGTSASFIRFGRNTNTSGNVYWAFNVPNSTNINNQLGGNTNSWVNAYNSNFGVGTISPDQKLDVESTSSPQFQVSYDESNATTFSTSSSGDLTITPSGGDVTISGNLSVSGTVNNPASAVDTDATVDTAATSVAIFTSSTTTTLTASNVVAGRCFTAIITSTSGGAISFAGFTPRWMDGSAPGSITATKKTAITCMGTGANTADCIDKENY